MNAVDKNTYAANRLRELRKMRGLTLENLAKIIHPKVSYATIQKLETGNMRLTVDYMEHIAEALNVKPSDFIQKGKIEIEPSLPTDQFIAVESIECCLDVQIRPDLKVTISGLPFDLTTSEASKISNIILAHVNG